MSVVVFSPDHDSLVRYERPSAVFEAYRHDEVPQILAFLEGEVERTGLHGRRPRNGLREHVGGGGVRGSGRAVRRRR